MWGRSSSTPGGQIQLGPSPVSGLVAPIMGTAPLSSTEVLLRNILGLLRVAEENARHHERRTQHEKGDCLIYGSWVFCLFDTFDALLF